MYATIYFSLFISQYENIVSLATFGHHTLSEFQNNSNGVRCPDRMHSICWAPLINFGNSMVMFINVSFHHSPSFQTGTEKNGITWIHIGKMWLIPVFFFWWRTNSSRATQIVSVLYAWAGEDQLIKMTGGKKNSVTIIELQFRIFEFFVFSLLLMVVHQKVTQINMRECFRRCPAWRPNWPPNSSGLGKRFINIHVLDFDVF